MDTHFIEAGNGWNWGKFLVAHFDAEEWERRSEAPFAQDAGKLLLGRGWDPRRHTFVMDLQTGEGAMFALGGVADYDLHEKHQIWTCPLFPPFLAWLYEYYKAHPEDWQETLPHYVELPDAPTALAGTRGRGPTDDRHAQDGPLRLAQRAVRARPRERQGHPQRQRRVVP